MRSPRPANGTLSETTERPTRVVEIMKLRDALSRITSRAEAADLLGIVPRTLGRAVEGAGVGGELETSRARPGLIRLQPRSLDPTH